jgi:hypothetical protein
LFVAQTRFYRASGKRQVSKHGQHDWVVSWQFRYFWVCGLLAGWLVAQGISEVSKALISGALGFCPAFFKLRFVAAFGVSGGALVILLGGQCHKLFLGLR